MITDKTEFPVYLFSNGSKDIFPHNSPGHFRNRLGQPLNLPGKWEVGLSMMHYPNNWKNIKMDCEFQIIFHVDNKVLNSLQRYYIHQIFEAGYYESTEQLRIIMNSLIKKRLDEYIAKADHIEILFTHDYLVRNFEQPVAIPIKYPEFIYDENLQRMILNSNDFREFSIRFVKGFDLCRALGYNVGVGLWKGATANEPAHFAPSLTMNFPTLFVYSSIIEPINVGDVSAPLLGLVPVKGKFQQYTYERFEKPIYILLSQNYISEIEIKLTDSTGNNILFGDGVVGLLLHFRRHN